MNPYAYGEDAGSERRKLEARSQIADLRWRVRARSILASFVLHGGIAFALLRAPVPAPKREPVVVEVEVARPPPKEAPPPEEAPRRDPTPARAPAPRKLASVTPPPVAPAPAPAPEPAAPFESGLSLDNAAGSGVAVPPSRGQPPVEKTPAPRRAPAAAGGGDDGCPEPPSKPAILERPTAIEYPTQARESGVEGRLVLKLTIARDGTVAEVETVQSVDPSLDALAVAAVKAWRFQPATRCGKPVDGGVYTVARRFELGD